MSEDDFWRRVEDGILPPRPQAVISKPAGEVLDAKLVRDLIRKVGKTKDKISQLTKADAIARWRRHLADCGT